MSDAVIIKDGVFHVMEIGGAAGAPSAAIAQAAAAAALADRLLADADAAGAAASETEAAVQASAASGFASDASASSIAAGTARTGAEAAEAAVLAALSGTSLSSANIACASRAILAAASHSAGLPAILTEAGHEGVFVWSGAVNLSAKVTMDTAQLKYVAPTSDTTGASGAWIRITGAFGNSAEWAGIVYEDSGSRAINDAALMKAAEFNPVASQYFSPITRLGPFWTYLSATFEPDRVVNMEGHTGYGGSSNNGTRRAQTVLVAPANTTVMRIKTDGCVGAGGTTSVAGAKGSDRSRITGIGVTQDSGGTDLTAHGWDIRGSLTLVDCPVLDVSGDGYHIEASGGGSPRYGNADSWQIVRGYVHATLGNGLYVDGADTNAGLCLGFEVHQANLCGIRDSAHFVNNYHGLQITGYSQGATRGVWYNGNNYWLIDPTNVGLQPDTHPAVWAWAAAAAAASSQYPAWDAGTTYTLMNPIWASSPSCFWGPYVEGGGAYGICHAREGLAIGPNMGWSFFSNNISPHSTWGITTQRGIGHYRSTGGQTSHPSYPYWGSEEITIVACPLPGDADVNKRAYLLKHRVNGFDFRIGYGDDGSGKDIIANYGGKAIYGWTGMETALTFGRSAAVTAMFMLTDVALIDPGNSGNNQILGRRAASPTSGSVAKGETYISSVGNAAGKAGWYVTTGGTAGSTAVIKPFGAIDA